MEIILQDTKKKAILSDLVFSQKFNSDLVHQVVTLYSSMSRQGTKSQKSKAEVSGSGKKPWRQKGTGRARVGSIRSPIWRSGGVTFAAKPKKFNFKLNKKMYKNAIRSMLSELIRKKRVIVVDSLSLKFPKTKLLLKKLKEILVTNVIIFLYKENKNLFLASRNLYKVQTKLVNFINPIDLISFENVLFTKKAIEKLEEIFK